jgi:hypothetical protein
MIIFAFGNGFSGTRTMVKLLDLSPDIDCGHERKTLESPTALFDKYLKVYSGELDPADVIKEERLPLVNRTTKHFAEVNGLLGYYIRGLNEIWPDAKYIHMYREPRTHIPTAYNRGMFLYNDIMKNIAQTWPTPPNNITRIERCAWWWADYNEFVLEQLKSIPDDQVFTIKFEDFINNIRIKELFEFLNLPCPPQEQIISALQKKLGKVDYRKMAEIRGVADPIMNWPSIPNKQKDLCKQWFENTLAKLETR